MSMLPTKKSEIDLDLSKHVILLYGRAKTGKSTLCSQFPDALFLATEPGLSGLEVFKTNITKWEDLGKVYGELTDKPHKFKTIVIDTIDKMVTMASEYICRENKISHPGELPHGKGWYLVTSALNKALTSFANLPTGLIMVSHSCMVEVETKTKKYTQYTINVSGKNKNLFLDIADLILYLTSEVDKDGEEKRFILTKPSMYYEAGDRFNVLPEKIELDYKTLASYFTNKETKETK